MQEESTPALNRRRLLRRAGTVAAGLGAAGVATAVTASPAAAADGEAVIQGQVNTGSDATTTIENLSSTKPTLSLKNKGVGPALHVHPSDQDSITPTAPVGTIYIDGYGDFSTVGNLHAVQNPDGSWSTVPGTPYVTMSYSPTWATMVIPTTSFRFYDSWLSRSTSSRNEFPDNHARKLFGNIVEGTPGGNDGGQVVPTAATADADLVLDFSEIFVPNDGVMAVQANLTCVGGSGSGYAALWGEGDVWPGNSSVNVVRGQGTSNFTQTALDGELKLRVKLHGGSARVIIDVVGFVVSDRFTQFNEGPATPPAVAKAVKRSYVRRPVTRG